MINITQYFQAKPHNMTHEIAALDLLGRVNDLLEELNYEPPYCPNTGAQISGSKGGAGDGGFRLSTSTTGAGGSSHKDAKGIDIYDPIDHLDSILTDSLLERHGLYREHPSKTKTWCHLSTRAPKSGRRTFYP